MDFDHLVVCRIQTEALTESAKGQKIINEQRVAAFLHFSLKFETFKGEIVKGLCFPNEERTE